MIAFLDGSYTLEYLHIKIPIYDRDVCATRYINVNAPNCRHSLDQCFRDG